MGVVGLGAPLHGRMWAAFGRCAPVAVPARWPAPSAGTSTMGTACGSPICEHEPAIEANPWMIGAYEASCANTSEHRRGRRESHRPQPVPRRRMAVGSGPPTADRRRHAPVHASPARARANELARLTRAASLSLYGGKPSEGDCAVAYNAWPLSAAFAFRCRGATTRATS